MAKAKFDIKSIDIPSAAQKPLFAGVGATDLAVTAVIEYVSDVQKKLTDVQKDVSKSVNDFEPKALRDQALKTAAARRDAVEARVVELQKDAFALPTKVSSRVSTVVNDTAATVTGTYADLAKHGEAVFKGTKTLSTATVEVKVNTTNPKNTKGTAKPAVAKTPVAKKASAKKAPAKKAPAKQAATDAKTSAQKATRATKTSAQKATTAAKKAPAKKSTSA